MGRKKSFKKKLSPFSARALRHEQLTQAVNWCRLNGKGYKACLSHAKKEKKWPLVKVDSLKRRLKGIVKNGRENEARQVLTIDEEEQLITWMVQSNREHNGKTEPDVKAKVIEILMHRRHQLITMRKNNKAGGRNYIKLSSVAKNILKKQKVGGKLLKRLKRKYQDRLDTKNTEKVTTRRAEKNNDEVVDRHFNGEAGLEKTLLKLGIMDPVTKRIQSPERVLNKDETPQMIDYETTKSGQKKVFTGRGEDAFRNVAETRECQTLDVTWGLDGWQYHAHLVVNRKSVTDDFVQPETEVFDGTIDVVNKVSRKLLISPTEKGSQTGTSFLASMKELKAELEERKIQFPVCLCLDNHISRYDDDVIQWGEDNGIEFFFEESNTSGFLQALDQYNRQLHLKYNEAKDLYKKGRALYMVSNGSQKVDYTTVKINLVDFVRILATFWFTWSSIADRIKSFMEVGITKEGLFPELINRCKFTAISDSGGGAQSGGVGANGGGVGARCRGGKGPRRSSALLGSALVGSNLNFISYCRCFPPL